MKKNLKKTLTFLMSFILILSMIPFSASGVDSAEYETSTETNTETNTETSTDYLCFTSGADNAFMSILTVDFPKELLPNLMYTTDTDLSSWTDFVFGTTIIDLNAGEKVYFRAKGTNNNFSISPTQFLCFIMVGNLEVSGNIMSLLNENCTMTDIPCDYCFTQLFVNLDYLGIMGCSTIKTASDLKLPADKLTEGCYMGMFFHCADLVFPPELPSKNIAAACYSSMFYGCYSMISSPELPAEKSEDGCYSHMFFNCISLENAPELPALKLTDSCYYNMFNGCLSLVKSPALPATELEYACYIGMFANCVSLQEIPAVLPATSLAEYCYQSMFMNCISLVTACELPATSLVKRCYTGMFNGCLSLEYISVAFTDWNELFSSTDFWVSGVQGEGTFICPYGLVVEADENNKLPSGWLDHVIRVGAVIISTGSDMIFVDKTMHLPNEIVTLTLNGSDDNEIEKLIISFTDADGNTTETDITKVAENEYQFTMPSGSDVEVIPVMHEYSDECVCASNGHYHICVNCGHSGKIIPHDFENGICKDCGYCSYDFDNDGIITEEDAVELLMRVLFVGELPDYYDVNGDGSVDSDDAIAVLFLSIL